MRTAAALALLIILALPAQGFIPKGEEASNLALRVYVDEVGVGRALVTGYVNDIRSLGFLKASDYRYENSTHLLYALTDSLIWRSEDGWNLEFSAGGNLDELHTAFYFPKSVALRKIDCSEGLAYQVSESDESIIVDMGGYDVVNPRISIEYESLQTTQ